MSEDRDINRLRITAVLLVFGLLSTGCAFLDQVIDRSGFEKAELMRDELLPHRDLPDIVAGIANEWGGGAGGGAVGGCWN